MFRFLTLSMLSALAASAATAQTMTPTNSEGFVVAAGQSDQFEIQEGKLAEAKGSASVKTFGAEMVREHTQTTANLMLAVKKAGMTPPPPPALRPDQLSMISQLESLSGAAFDRAYLTQQVEAHQQALALMVNYAKAGDTPALQQAAEKTAPLVRMHLAMAEKMAK